MKKENKQKKTFFHYFGIVCLIFILLFIAGFFLVFGANQADSYEKKQEHLVSQYFICSSNMRELGENLCNRVNDSFSYYYPIGFAYGEDLNFEYIRCNGGELFSLLGEHNSD